MKSNLILGVDGGGTSTVAWLGDGSGAVLGRGRAGASNAKAVGTAAAFESLAAAIASAFEDAGLPAGPVDVACLGLAGFDRPADRQLLGDWSARTERASKLLLGNDGDLVVAAGTPEGWGLGVIAGTGSIAVGRAPDGKTARAGGWGHLFGDEGSAYGVALAALRRVARTTDGRARKRLGRDPLTEHLCAAVGVAVPSELVTAIYAPGFDRTRIAALAPLVVAASTEDPTIVDDLLEPAGRELAEAIAAVARSLGWSSGPIPLALAGGFLLATEHVFRSLIAHLERLGYQPDARPVAEPVQGALILARKEAVAGSDRRPLE